MKLKENVLIFSDLDGTALASNHKFSEETKEIVRKVYKKNYYFIPVTARCTMDTFEQQSIYLELDKLKGIASANNGTHIYDFKENKWIRQEYISQETLKEVFDITFGKVGKYKAHFIGDDTYFVYGHGENSRYWSDIMGTEYKVVQNFKDIDKKINHITIILEKNPSDKSIEEFYKDFSSILNALDIIKYTDRVYELAIKDIHKGSVVKEVLNYLGLNESNTTTIGFGDNFNDFELATKVDIFVAMENGLQKLKNIATFTTKTNDENGVANFIEKNIL
ncbi:HAD-IIB family hydrolase [Spiroplasma floricola]|uniref:HAD superfamily hydrolase n=1 Tax=Spiroplasma floricola 23-6 TaxID=1336749 RepID=A0A2K8SCI7_9MOLU|nr:HAD-IIB family hydrolase [Spiroplasma floricola]AUB31187.1 HAD superfamily hydrolase [Spiroplasma floricola 23-6]